MKRVSYRKLIKSLTKEAQPGIPARPRRSGNIFTPNWLQIMEAEFIGNETFDLYFRYDHGRYQFTQLKAPVKKIKAHTQHVHGWVDPTKNNNILNFYIKKGILVITDTDTKEYALAYNNAIALSPNIGEEQKTMEQLKKYEYEHQGPLLGEVVVDFSKEAIVETENVRATNPTTAPQTGLNPAGASSRIKKRAARLNRVKTGKK